MTWSILFLLILVLGVAILGLLHRRAGLRSMRVTLAERAVARATGSANPQLQYPAVDLTRCVGCGACVRACPEEGVLGLVHGQAAVVHGARCVGHGRCADVCPVDAVVVTLGDLSSRKDIPVLSDGLEADDVPGLFLAGEVTGYALVRTAINHGRTVAAQVIQRAASAGTAASAGRVAAAGSGAGHATTPRRGVHPRAARRSHSVADREPASATVDASSPPLDLVVVGAGPAGLSCGLAAKEGGLDFVILERDTVGGAVAKYPRRKLVLTQPVELPLFGTLAKSTYVKEDLVRIWEGIVQRFELPIRTGEEFIGLERDAAGIFTVRTKGGEFRARNVCLGLGRRGTPRKLGVPGEELPKVVYSLIDAEAYQGRHILVVGGGDSAIEAAIGLAEQPGNRVTLSYRKAGFFRIKAKNRSGIEQRVAAGMIRVLFESELLEIGADRTILSVARCDGSGDRQTIEFVNDDVFIFAGGVPPFRLLEVSGVSFDATKRPPAIENGEQGTGILGALVWGLGLTLATLTWCACFRDYYELDWNLRPESPWHQRLAPTGGVGLAMGSAATFLIVLNLVYIVRRSRLGRYVAGSVQNWLSIHVVSGILALLFLVVHGGMVVRETTGGLAFLAVVVLVISGGIGRYFYAHLPKAANGRNLDREQAREALESTLADWDRAGRGLAMEVRSQLDALLHHDHWGDSLWRRIVGLLTTKARFRTRLARVERAAHSRGVGRREIRDLVGRARSLHRAGLMAMHYEELRGLVGSWRTVHRWLALAMVLLAAHHIVTGLRYARFW